MIGLLQELKRQLCDVAPRLLDVTRLGGSRADGESQDKLAAELTRHQVDLPAFVYPLQQLLVQLVGALRREHPAQPSRLTKDKYWRGEESSYLEPEADQPHDDLSADLEPVVRSHQALKLFCQAHLLKDTQIVVQFDAATAFLWSR